MTEWQKSVRKEICRILQDNNSCTADCYDPGFHICNTGACFEQLIQVEIKLALGEIELDFTRPDPQLESIVKILEKRGK